MQKLLVGMSGGVDSSAAVALLQKQGFAVGGVTLQLYGTPPDIADAAAVAHTLGISHTVLDLRDRFEEAVIRPFVESYEAGQTPNPCLICNRRIKFGAMLDYALENGYDGIATGHYVKSAVDPISGRHLLLRPSDRSKDQTYVLYSLTQHQLAHAHFPLGGYSKAQIRDLAAQTGLSVAQKADSQDICFVPNGKYAEFIESYRGRPCATGDYVDTSGKPLGQHGGIIRYTIGQRKGLGIALGRPMFVISKDAATREVVLGEEALLFCKTVRLRDVNLIALPSLDAPLRVLAKIRYNQTEQPAILHPDGDGLVLEFDRPQRAITPGQAAVFYDNDVLVGGGVIVSGS